MIVMENYDYNKIMFNEFKAEIVNKTRWNSIIPLDEFILIVHYFNNNMYPIADGFLGKYEDYLKNFNGIITPFQDLGEKFNEYFII